MQITPDQLRQLQLSTNSDPERSTKGLLDADFPESDPSDISAGPASGLPGINEEFAPTAPAAKPAPTKPEEKIEEVTLTPEEAADFEAFRAVRQAEKNFADFRKAHPDYAPTPVNGEIFSAWMTSKGLADAGPESMTPALLESFYHDCASYLDRPGVTTPPLLEHGPRVIVVRDSRGPVSTALPAAGGHHAPVEGELTNADVAARIANMPIDEARRWMTALMRQQNKGRQ